MTLQSSVRSVIASYGQAMTIRRASAAAGANNWTQGTLTTTYTAAIGRARGYKPSQIVAGIQADDMRITLDAGFMSLVPTLKDQIALGTFTGDAGADWLRIVSVYVPRVAGSGFMYVCQVRR